MGFGHFGDGRQWVSWIHEHDFVAAVKFLIERDDLAGAVNLAVPDPLPFHGFDFAELRRQPVSRLAIPIPVWALEIGTFFLRTETELILVSPRDSDPSPEKRFHLPLSQLADCGDGADETLDGANPTSHIMILTRASSAASPENRL